MYSLPVEWAFLGQKIGAAKMLWRIISNQAVEIECVRIFGFLDTVIEPTCDNGVSNPTEFLRFSFSYIKLEVIFGQ